MARDFSKNTSNYLSLGVDGINAIASGASAITYAAWVQADSFGTAATDNRIISECVSGTNVTGIALAVGNSPAVLAAYARSQSADSLQTKTGTTTVATGVWHHVAAVYDFAGDTITPYLNGVAEGGGSVTFGATTYTPSATTAHAGIGTGFSVGSPLSTAAQFDGRIGEVAIWRIGLSPGRIRAIANGASPEGVRPESLVAYFRLDGTGSAEFNAAARTPIGTISGSVPQGVPVPLPPPPGSLEDWFLYSPPAAGGVAGPVLYHSHYVNQGWR